MPHRDQRPPSAQSAHEFHRHLDDAAENEGLDDELLRHCEGLLDAEIEDRSARIDPDPADRVAGLADRVAQRLAGRHLVAARLAYEAGLFDRATAEVVAALALTPNADAPLRLYAAIHHRRGRLSDAIAIWQDLAARTAGGASALRQLSHVFELALLDSASRARSAPTALEASLQGALVELEQSFRLALDGNVAGALRAVDKVAARSKSADRYLFKIATIQRAWLLEQSHDVPAAIATMERLADEPGLANDIERLLCLSVLYEREGTPERIRRAVRAVRHAYLATGQPTLLRRLARLLAQLGYARLADRFETRYLELFRRRMHALTLRELTRGATAAYTPIDKLAGIDPPRAELEALLERHATRRRAQHRSRAALLALLLGDLPRAHGLLRALDGSGEATPVDLLYLGDVEEALGDKPTAIAARIRSLRASREPDASALLKLFGARDAKPADLYDAPADEHRAEQARRTLHAYTRAHPGSAEALRALAEIDHMTGRTEQGLEHEAHALALEGARAREERFVLAAAALRRGGEVHGLVHELWVDARRTAPGAGGGLEPADVLGVVTPELRAYAVNVFYSVKAYAAARFPHRMGDVDDRRFILKLTKDDEPSSGESAGLPIAIAFLSALLGLAVPRDVAFSGAIVCDAHDVIVLRRIGDVEAKVEGAFERRLRRLVLPAENRGDVERAERVPREVARHLVFFARTLDDVCAAVFPELRE